MKTCLKDIGLNICVNSCVHEKEDNYNTLKMACFKTILIVKKSLFFAQIKLAKNVITKLLKGLAIANIFKEK